MSVNYFRLLRKWVYLYRTRLSEIYKTNTGKGLLTIESKAMLNGLVVDAVKRLLSRQIVLYICTNHETRSQNIGDDVF
jgi:hypothetical protein